MGMITNHYNDERDLDSTDEFPVLSESLVLLAQDAAESNGADQPRTTGEPVRAAVSLTQLEVEIARLHAKSHSIDLELKSRDARIVELQDAVEARESTIAKLTAEVERETVALTVADERLTRKDAEIAALIGGQRSRDERIEALSKKLVDAESRHEDTRRKIARAEYETARLNDLVRRERAAAAGTTESNQRLLAEHAVLQSKLQDLEIYINARHERWCELDAHLAAYKNSLSRMEQTLKARDAIIARHAGDNRQLTASIHDLQCQCWELAGRRKEREMAYDQLQEKFASQHAQVEQLKTEYANHTKKTTTAKTALCTRIDELEKTLAARVQQAEALRDGLRISHDQLRLTQDELSERTAQLASSQEALDHKSRNAEELAGERDTAQKESARLRAELETLGAHASELGRLRGEAVAEAERLKIELAAQQKIVGRLETHLRAKQVTADLLERSVDRITGSGASLATLSADDKPTAATQSARDSGNAELLSMDRLPDGAAGGNTVDIGERSEIETARKLVITIDGRSFDYPILKKQMTIGRGHGSDIRIVSHLVSRVHARISITSAGTIIEDAGSKNGLLVNAERVLRRVLRDGDVVTLSDDVNLRFVDATH